MSLLSKQKLKDKITWWRVSAPDGYGGDQVADPVVVDGRWNDSQQLFRSQVDSREQISMAVVFLDMDVSVGDYLYRGEAPTVTDPAQLPGAYKIQRFDKVANIRSNDWVRTATL